MIVGGRVTRSDIPGLCRRARTLLAGGADLLVCDVSGVDEADLCTVEALARLHLTATRLGRRLELRHPPEGLQELLAVTGLDDLLLTCPEGRDRPSDGQGGAG